MGTAQAIQESVPESATAQTKTPFRAEYPARAPSAFQPGWPM